MKRILLGLAVSLAACGSDEDDEPPPEITRLGFSDASCFASLGSCSGFIKGTCSSDKCPPSGWSFVASVVEGPTAPAACDGNSTPADFFTTIQLKNLKLTTMYSARACLFENSSGKYTSGAVTTFTTPAS